MFRDPRDGIGRYIDLSLVKLNRALKFRERSIPQAYRERRTKKIKDLTVLLKAAEQRVEEASTQTTLLNHQLDMAESRLSSSEEQLQQRGRVIEGLQDNIHRLRTGYGSLLNGIRKIKRDWIALRYGSKSPNFGEFPIEAEEVIGYLEQRIADSEHDSNALVEEKITRRRIESAMLNTMVQMVVEAVPEVKKTAWFYIGPAGKVAYASPRLEKLTGINPETIQNKHIAELLHRLPKPEDVVSSVTAWRENDTSYHTITLPSEENKVRKVDIYTHNIKGYDEKTIGTAVYLRPSKGLGKLNTRQHKKIAARIASLAQNIKELYPSPGAELVVT